MLVDLVLAAMDDMKGAGGFGWDLSGADVVKLQSMRSCLRATCLLTGGWKSGVHTHVSQGTCWKLVHTKPNIDMVLHYDSKHSRMRFKALPLREDGTVSYFLEYFLSVTDYF